MKWRGLCLACLLNRIVFVFSILGCLFTVFLLLVVILIRFIVSFILVDRFLRFTPFYFMINLFFVSHSVRSFVLVWFVYLQLLLRELFLCFCSFIRSHSLCLFTISLILTVLFLYFSVHSHLLCLFTISLLLSVLFLCFSVHFVYLQFHFHLVCCFCVFLLWFFKRLLSLAYLVALFSNLSLFHSSVSDFSVVSNFLFFSRVFSRILTYHLSNIFCYLWRFSCIHLVPLLPFNLFTWIFPVFNLTLLYPLFSNFSFPGLLLFLLIFFYFFSLKTVFFITYV